MPQLHDSSIRTFNPGTFQPDVDICRQFVARHHELATTLAILRRNVKARSCQHILLEGPRGYGKTMLLARVAAELRTDQHLAQHLLPVRLPEECHEVFTLADFWLEVLLYLAPEVARSHPDEHEDIVGASGLLLSDWRSVALEERALTAVCDAATRLERRLVIMVENLQDLCEDVDDQFSRKLQQVLTNHPQLILLATATAKPNDIVLRDIFQTVRLKPLTTANCGDLWTVITGRRIARGSAELVGALEGLTGGNPRLLTILGSIAASSRSRSAARLQDFLGLLDVHTEYFRRHLQELPKTERRVYLAVADLWDTVATPTEISERAHIDIRTVSTMLGRLFKRGMLERDDTGRRYYLTERLFAYYYKFRRRDYDDLAMHFISYLDRAIFVPAALESVQDDVRSGRDSEAVAAIAELGLTAQGAATPGPRTDRGVITTMDARTLRELAAVTVQQNAAWDEHGRVEHLTLTIDARGVPAAIGRLGSLKSLSIGGYGGDVVIPKELGTLTRLSGLRINGGRVEVPDSLGALTRLSDLELNGGEVVVPDTIGRLSRLARLRIQGQLEGSSPNAAISKLTALTQLELSMGAVTDGLAEAIGKLSGLNSLDLVGDLTDDLAGAIGALGDLRNLGLVRTSPGRIPGSIQGLAKLTELCLTGQFRDHIADAITTHSGLRRLTLFGQFTGEIPESIGNLKNLTWLTLHGNFTGEIPNSIGDLAKLTKLTIEGQFTGKIPKSLGRLTELRWLTLRGDFTGELPNTFSKLVNIVELDLPGHLKSPPDGNFMREIFRRAYTEFNPGPGESAPIAGMVNQAMRCIAVGVSERELLDIVESNGYKAKTLAPLVAALRMRAGEAVSEARAIMEAAEDINARIAKGIGFGKTYGAVWRMLKQLGGVRGVV